MLFSAFRSAVLAHLRLPAPTMLSQAGPVMSNVVIRAFSGGFLDKDKVTERVIYVAKHFEKVDPAKVSGKRADGCMDNEVVSASGIIADGWCHGSACAWGVHGRARRLLHLQVSPSANFEKDLGLDSLDVVELVMALEEEFGVEIPDAEADKIASVSDAVNYLMSNPLAK